MVAGSPAPPSPHKSEPASLTSTASHTSEETVTAEVLNEHITVTAGCHRQATSGLQQDQSARHTSGNACIVIKGACQVHFAFAAPSAPLYRIHTSSPEAQALFDQGLLLTYNYNRPEVRGEGGGERRRGW